MILINNINEQTFSLNGINYTKNFVAIKTGEESLMISNLYDTKFQLLAPTKYNEILVNGVGYANVTLLMNVLTSILFFKKNVQDVPYLGSIVPTSISTGSTGAGFWTATQAGTYTNFGNVVVSGNSFAIISRNSAGTTFSISQSQFDLSAYVATTAITSTKTYGATDALNTYTSTTSGEGVKANYLDIKEDGVLSKINFWCSRAGVLTFKVVRKDNAGVNSYVSGITITYSASSTGAHVINTNYNVKAGDNLVFHMADSTGMVGFKVKAGGLIIGFVGGLSNPNPVFTLAGGYEHGFNYQIDLPKIDALNAGQANINSNLYTTEFLEYRTLTENSTVSTLTTRALGTPFTQNGYLSKIVCNVTVAGLLKFKIFAQNLDNSYNITKELSLYTPVTGNSITFDVAYLRIPVTKNGLFGFVLGGVTNGQIGYDTLNPRNTFSFGQFEVTGNNLTTSVIASTSLGCYIEVLSENYQRNNVTVAVDNAFASKKLLATKFYTENLPESFVQVGGWTPTTSGLTSPTTGGWSAMTYWEKLMVLDKDEVKVKVAVNSSTSIFSLARVSTQTLGTIFEVNFSSNTINVYSSPASISGTPSSIIATTGLTVTYVAGREYYLTIKKVSEMYYFSFTDSVTGVFDTITFNSTANVSNIGKCWNSPAVIFRQGSIKVLEMTYYSNMPISPTALVIGDSITEGDSIRNEPNGGATKRWVGLLETALNGNITIVARAGETSTQVSQKLPLIDKIIDAPSYIIYAIGTNDSDYSTWYNNMLQVKAIADKSGAELVLTTLFPRAGREAFNLAVTNFILTSGFRYIDYAKALTVNGDRVTRNSSLLLPDDLHPTPAGHAKMYQQIQIDMPELF